MTVEPSVPARATPLVDAYFEHLAPDVERAYAQIDAAELTAQKARVAPHIAAKLTAPTHSVHKQLARWEQLSQWLRDATPAGPTYLLDEYIDYLDTRDSLAELAGRLDDPAHSSLEKILTALDAEFAHVTVDDAGQTLRYRARETPEGMARRAWWWHRRPTVIPWQENAR